MDEINFNKYTFYNVEITKYVDFSSLQDLDYTNISTTIIDKNNGDGKNKRNHY